MPSQTAESFERHSDQDQHTMPASNPANPASLSRSVQTLALVGTYQPRQCGIATFTQDLRNSIASVVGSNNTRVIAIDDLPGAYAYNEEVTLNLPQQSRRDYRLAADLLNVNQIDCVVVQHEYGIFGGENGKYILDMVHRLRMPVITTLHTLLTHPSPGERDIMCEIVDQSARVVVMTERGRDILTQTYGVADAKIALIPHGVHEQSFSDPHFYAEQLGLQGKRVLLTFGLMGPGKGLETALRALPAIVEAHPNTVYLIVGATHPHVLRREGTQYRQSLEALATSLGVRDHVQFHERFVSVEELSVFLGVADVYVMPYPNLQQVTSGTLAYAIGAGKAVVSTPFWHAQELLADGRGRLFPFNDYDALSTCVIELLGDDDQRNAIRRRAYQHSRDMLWCNIGKKYVELAQQVLYERHQGVDRQLTVPHTLTALSLENEPSLDHILRISDDCGMLQHARFALPDRHHGYCIDDNARALIGTIDYYRLREDQRCLPLIDRYLAFIAHALNESSGRFRNFMDYQRNWQEEAGSEDSHGRAMWSLGHCVKYAPQESQRLVAYQLFKLASKAVESFRSPRAWAFTLLGLKRFNDQIGIDLEVTNHLRSLATRLHSWHLAGQTEQWPWPEPLLTYDNARIAQALIECGETLDDTTMKEEGIATLNWIVNLQVNSSGVVSLVGNQGWASSDGTRARFDQQPLEAAAVIDACEAAYGVSADDQWFDSAKSFYLWFLGANDLSLALRDAVSGGCADGLHATGVNYNQGAESSLACFMGTLAIQRLYAQAIQLGVHSIRSAAFESPDGVHSRPAEVS